MEEHLARGVSGLLAGAACGALLTLWSLAVTALPDLLAARGGRAARAEGLSFGLFVLYPLCGAAVGAGVGLLIGMAR